MITLQILIPAYNADKYIQETIESVLNQSFKDFEIIIVDNASTDKTQSVASSFTDSRLKYIRNESNIGGIQNHNRCIELAKAKYIKILSADDVLLPEILKKQVAALDMYQDVGVVSCDCVVTDASLKPTSTSKYLQGYWNGRNAVNKCVFRVANLVGAPSNTMIRTSILQDTRFDPTLKWLGDLEFVCQLLAHTDYLNINEFGFMYRRHDASDSVIGCSKKIRFHDEFRFVIKHGVPFLSLARIIARYCKIYLGKT